MATFLLYLVVALVAAGIVFGVAVLILDRDSGLAPAEPDDQVRALPTTRPLIESDVAALRFDTAIRGYRMAQVDQSLARLGYDLGYKEELIHALEAEVQALRDGRAEDADELARAREAAVVGASQGAVAPFDPTGDPAGVPEDEAADPDQPAAGPADSSGDDAATGDAATGDAATSGSASGGPPTNDDPRRENEALAPPR